MRCKTEIKLFVDGKVNPLILAMPLKERGELLLNCLTQSGCDLRPYLRCPTVAYGGKQRSGKTTLGMLSLILQKAIDGQKIYYVTADRDIPPVAFDGYMTSFDCDARKAVTRLHHVYTRYLQLVTQSKPKEIGKQSWLLDEFTLSIFKLNSLAEAVWHSVLAKTTVQVARTSVVLHEKTASANRVPAGKANLFKEEVAFLWTNRQENVPGDPGTAPYSPSGKYVQLALSSNPASLTEEIVQTPDWLMFDVDPNWHHAPCPVRSLLHFFPEFDVRAGAIAQNLLQDEQILPSAPQASPESSCQ